MCLRSGTHQPTNLQNNQVHVVQVLIFPALSARPADAMHIKCVHELTSVVPQHQLEREMLHLSRYGGGQAVRVRDLHRAGTHDQQHRYVRTDVLDQQLLHGCLHHRHGSCAVFCEDLTAEERMLYLL